MDPPLIEWDTYQKIDYVDIYNRYIISLNELKYVGQHLFAYLLDHYEDSLV